MTRKQFAIAENITARIDCINQSLEWIEHTPDINIKYLGCDINARLTATEAPIYQIRLDGKILETIRSKSRIELLAHKARFEKELSDLGITIED
jgi:hypothetical protein